MLITVNQKESSNMSILNSNKINWIPFLLNFALTLGVDEYRFALDSSLNNWVCSLSDRSFIIQASSKAYCAQICSKNMDTCSSFFFSKSFKTCTGCPSVYTDTTDLVSSVGTVYYHLPASVSSTSTEMSGLDCLAIKQTYPSATSGIYNVTLTSNRNIMVFCDMDTEDGGWTVFQYRYNGAEDFYRTYQEYTDGFGDISSEFWLGLQNIHEMAAPGVQSEIYVYLVDGFGQTKVEQASTFSLGPSPAFTIQLEQGGNSLTYNDGASFSTFDYGPKPGCSSQRRSGWWHWSCTWINPNGLYVTPGTSATSPSGWAGVIHVPWKSFKSMAVTKLMFRRV